MTEPVLACHDLTKAFGALRATQAVSLDLQPGEIHALIGPNGAGKSTLIAQIAGALRPDAGTIRFLGRDVTALDTAARARVGLGRSFQISAVLPDFTVLQNVMMAAFARHRRLSIWHRALKMPEARDAAADPLERTGLIDRAAMPASDLSHAERRRLELAMALALKPRAFLLDEPMAGMGTEGTARMTRLLDDLRHNAPILLVEHDMDAVFELADRITVLDSGAVLATGSVADVRADPAVRAAYLGTEDAS